MGRPDRIAPLAVGLGLALLAGLFASASASAGSLVIAGGALRPGTAAVWQRIVELAGGPGAPIAVLGTASAEPAESAASSVATLERYGAHAYYVPVVDAADAHDPALVARIATARGVFFTGGDQGRITRALVGGDGRRTPALDAVWNVHRDGGVVAGTSAGAAIMSTTMFYEPDDNASLVMHGLRPGRDIAPGLGFVGPGLFVDQHCLARGRFARTVMAMLASGTRRGLCIDEDTAAVVTADGIAITGRSGAVLVDLSDATGHAIGGPFAVHGARIGLLAAGDRYDAAAGAVTPAAGKQPLRIATAPGRPTLRYDDVLAKDVVADLLAALVRSTSAEAIGSARREDGGASDVRFAFRRTARTRGWRGDGAAGVLDTVVDIELDAAPR